MTELKASKAPDFTNKYPSAGEKIGPYWQALWDALGRRPGSWADGKALAQKYAAQFGCAPKTGLNLLHRAAGAGHIEQGYRVGARPVTRKYTPAGRYGKAVYRRVV